MNTPFRTVALIGKRKNPEVAEPLLRLARFLEERGIAILLDRFTAAHVGETRYTVLALEDIGRQADLAVVLGGDGTMLNIARTFAPYDVPLVGVNQGRLGFLTDVSVENMLETIGAMLDGHYVTDSRMLLAAEIFNDGESLFDVLAFNDAVVAKGLKGSMIEFDVHLDGEFLYTQRSDGLIVATPTGSTAYALSSGGPILHPSLDLLALVPICSHTLSSRPLVVSADSVVEVVLHEAGGAHAHFDSHSHFDLRNHDRVVVRRCPHKIRLLHPAGYDYFHMLREKLRWSEVL